MKPGFLSTPMDRRLPESAWVSIFLRNQTLTVKGNKTR